MEYKYFLNKLLKKEDLTYDEATEIMNSIMSGGLTDAQIAGFLVALRCKGATVTEITAFAKDMRDKAVKINTSGNEDILDTCGTGGDGSHTFNISTISAFVASGSGLKVAKHGNKAVSSQCGSADLLISLGVNIEIDVKKMEECLNKVGICFLFAPKLHQAMKYAIGPRRELGIHTIFNVLGPLTNPANANTHLLGVYDSILTEKLAHVLNNIGVKHAFVVNGEGVGDEISTIGKTTISEVKDNKVTTYTVTPQQFGILQASKIDLMGGMPEENASIARSILKGDKSPKRDIVILNSAFALTAGGKVDSITKGISLATEIIDSGKALEKLNKLIEFTKI